MTNYTIGEEVMFDEERFVIAGVSAEEPRRYRLLATTKKGAKFVWADPQKLEPMTSYIIPNDDTASY